VEEVKHQHSNIAKNKALRENIFMMIVCIENRIPLFLVGKPGSSKSLSKAMVIDAMKGEGATVPLFRNMKRVKHCATYKKSIQLFCGPNLCGITVGKIVHVYIQCAGIFCLVDKGSRIRIYTL